eukprot:RCo023655
MADPLVPVPALGLHVRRVDTTKHHIQVAVSHDGLVLYIPHPALLWKSLLQLLNHMQNQVVTAMWPASPAGFFALLSTCTATAMWMSPGALASELIGSEGAVAGVALAVSAAIFGAMKVMRLGL